MSKLNTDEVKKIAKLASLNLSESELEKFTKQLAEVVDYNVELLAKVKTEKIEPLLNVSGLTNATREDVPEPGLTQKQVLQNSKENHNGFFKVKQILEQ
jgi:aspartyl-tRNA(Asn)/glutamyl-tRNA(Gln) amidotransferase subunit C